MNGGRWIVSFFSTGKERTEKANFIHSATIYTQQLLFIHVNGWGEKKEKSESSATVAGMTAMEDDWASYHPVPSVSTGGFIG